MTAMARGSRVPGGASDNPTRVDNRPVASMAESTSDALVSCTAPARLCQSAMPPATPTLVTTSRMPSSVSASVDGGTALPTRAAATTASVAGLTTVSTTQRRRSQPRTGMITRGIINAVITVPLRIAFDMDGTLADLSSAYAEVEERLFGAADEEAKHPAPEVREQEQQ